MAFDPITAIAETVKTITDKIIPDANQRAAAVEKLAEMRLNGELQATAAEIGLLQGQVETNKIEAASSRLFVSGWRPFVGWTCGAAFCWSFVVGPIAAFILTACGHPVPTPTLAMSEITPVLLGMLGLAGMRSYERVQGVAPAALGGK